MTPKIVDYKVINGAWYWMKMPMDKKPSLDEEIAKAIKEGWQPIGGPVLTKSGEGVMQPPIISQAMVKYEG